MKRIAAALYLFVLILCLQLTSHSQSIFNPADLVINYDSVNPPSQPAWGQIGKWVRTPSMNWDASSYKCYIYKGIAFRLKFPKTYNHTANDGKKYPMMIFWHGRGEAGPLVDNEFHMLHGCDYFRYAVDQGIFDGYVIAMQTVSSYFSLAYYDAMKEIIEYMVVNNKLDPFRVTSNGLSAGGAAVWDMFLAYPTAIAGGIPMSSVGAGLADSAVVHKIKFTPYWNLHGGVDNSPTPYTAFYVRDAMLNAGGNYKNTMYPTLGHGTWYDTWAEPDFWPFLKRAYSSNPWPLFGRTEFCPGDLINITIGLVAGFDEYQWRKDGLPFGGNSNTITATQLGTYSARVRRGTLWSDWSPLPVELKLKTVTITPPIQISGLASKVLPALDGSTSVLLELPDGYVSYDWQKEGVAGTISTTRFLNVTEPADYKVKVAEQYSCSSQFSPLFKVVDANGSPKPDPAVNLIASTLSNSSIRLDWSENPSPQYNETGFEIYQATQPGGPYQFIGITAPNTITFTVTGLAPNKQYFFKVRAVNNTGAATPSNEIAGTTQADTKVPTSPVLEFTDITSTTVSLSWTRSTDDGGVANYEVYVNGIKTYVTTDTSFVVSNLATGTTYNFAIRAKDLGGNLSSFSNQVTATPSFGLKYKYYTYNNTWSSLPDFNSLSPDTTGKVQNVTLSPRTQDDKFAFLWEGYIRIPVTGTYYFKTTSDDGSKLYLGNLNATGSPYSYPGTPLVNNDGIHAPQDITSAPVVLQAGVYPIAISFFEEGGDQTMLLYWKTPLTGNSFESIPNIVFSDQPVTVSLPAIPGALKATAVSHRQINLTWTDNSNNETAFEIQRSTEPFSDFIPIARTGPNTTAFADTSLKHNTVYYYRIKAINQYGESGFDKPGQGVDYSYYQLMDISQLPDFNALTPYKSSKQPNIDLGMQDRVDNFQLKFSTTITVPKAGIYTFYLKSDDGSKLYLDGFNTANVLIDHDGWHGATEKTASKSLTKGSHTFYVTYFENYGPEELSVYIAGPGIPKQRIPDSWLGTPNASATTWTLPTAPLAPANFIATGSSSSTISLSWQDRSDNEIGFEIYRSAANNNGYVFYKTLPANATTYIDNGLFPNAVYYYKVRAITSVVSSAFTTEDSASALNGIPVITIIPDRTARYGVATIMEMTATDADGDALVFSAQNLPVFATLADHGNKTATLTLNPTIAQQGVYSNLKITAGDVNGGSAFTQFNLTVNGNYDPVITPIGDQAVNENNSLSIPLSATDQNPGDNISWSVSNLPAGYTLTPGANGSATLLLQTNYSSAGVYVVEVKATDGAGGFSIQNFNLTVTDAAPSSPVLTSAQYVYNSGVSLNWQDQSSSETGFEIWRSTTANGIYAMTGSVAANITTFTDNTATGNARYYYKVRSKNSVDASAYSNILSVFTNRIPQVNSISDVLLMTTQTSIVNISATDDASDIIKLSATGLPSFATLSDYGNGTGQINITPNTNSIGIYTVTVTAKDSYDSLMSATFTINIIDKDLTSVFLNLTDNSSIAGKPWNNLLNAAFQGSVYTGLKTESDNASGMTVTMPDGFGWTATSGMRTRNGREIFPEAVERTGVIEPSTATKKIEVSGLAVAGRLYNFIFFNSYDQELNFTTSFNIGSQTVTLNGKYNSAKTVQINGITPDATGKVTINVTKAPGADYALLSAIVIQSYPTTVQIVRPDNLRARATSRTSVSLDWQDRSNNESVSDGFEIYRADDSNPTFLSIGTVGSGVTAYTDAGLLKNRTYYYAVKARTSGNTYSTFSNVATANTLAYSVYINFNNVNKANTPWNNLNTAPQIGRTWNHLLDEVGQATSLGMTQPTLWAGVYGNGVNTSNNSGLYPDDVMVESYSLFPGEKGKMKITGLNVNMKYNFTFFGSANDYSDFTTAYSVGDRTSYMNASLNRSTALTMYDIVPDSNGEAIVTVAPGTATSQFGLLASLVIDAFTPSAGVPPTAARGEQFSPDPVFVPAAADTRFVKVFPNPFRQEFNLLIKAKANDEARVMIFDVSGAQVYQAHFKNLLEGENVLKIQPGVKLLPGTYFVKTVLGSVENLQVVRVVKQ